ncbi:hypothetical protein AGLY_000999 [Aphis glycines]|uniref:Uncharacterized protein n=1 Tax=Aphis glycines TaxID=307491 RepID=A0A6G0UB30_APHGL|nr:hypothetical protein AGLY_000999 [Aphis glycines]
MKPQNKRNYIKLILRPSYRFPSSELKCIENANLLKHLILYLKYFNKSLIILVVNIQNKNHLKTDNTTTNKNLNSDTTVNKNGCQLSKVFYCIKKIVKPSKCKYKHKFKVRVNTEIDNLEIILKRINENTYDSEAVDAFVIKKVLLKIEKWIGIHKIRLHKNINSDILRYRQKETNFYRDYKVSKTDLSSYTEGVRIMILILDSKYLEISVAYNHCRRVYVSIPSHSIILVTK